MVCNLRNSHTFSNKDIDVSKVVLNDRPSFSPSVVEEVANEMLGKGLGIQRLLLIAEMAVQRQKPVTKDIFMECLKHVGQ